MKKYINHDDMINTNCSNVLDIIQKNDNISRKQITELTGLSWGGMTKIVNKLLEKGYISETKSDSGSKSGRIPSILSINRQKNYVVGLDINKTGFKGIVMNLAGVVLKNYFVKVSAQTCDNMIEKVISFIKAIFKDFAPDTIISIGVSMQGEVDAKSGISVRYPDIKDWLNVPLRDILATQFGVNVYIEHDPDCILYYHINSETSNNISLFRIDESIGMAVALNGKILKGKSILEIAHNTVIPEGKMCKCGLKGCLEAYIPTADQNSSSIEEFLLPLCVAVKNSVNLFNSDTVILTGELIPRLNSYADKIMTTLQLYNCNTTVKFSENTDAAVMGIALIAIHKSINSLEI